jgi:hypothetical protein
MKPASDIESKEEWIALTPEQNENFVKAAAKCSGDHPSFFNLASDSNNAPGKFSAPSREQVLIEADEAGARFFS